MEHKVILLHILELQTSIKIDYQEEEVANNI